MFKRLAWLIILLIIFVAGIYLNRSYAHIYDEITMVNLTAPQYSTAYVLGDRAAAASSVYVALGDSLTAGVGTDQYEQAYPYLVAESLTTRLGGITLENKAYPGARTVDVINNQLDETIAAQPKIVTILVGINDVHGNINEATFAKNYEEIISRLTQETSARVYAVSIPYLGDNSLLRWPYNYYFAWRIRYFNQAIKDLAARYNVQYLDLYTPTVKTFSQAGPHYAADHFHPSASGYALWAPIIYDHLNQ